MKIKYIIPVLIASIVINANATAATIFINLMNNNIIDDDKKAGLNTNVNSMSESISKKEPEIQNAIKSQTTYFIDLSKNYFTDSGIENMITRLKSIRNSQEYLEGINLALNRVSIKGVELLYNIIELPNFKYLDITSTQAAMVEEINQIRCKLSESNFKKIIWIPEPYINGNLKNYNTINKESFNIHKTYYEYIRNIRPKPEDEVQNDILLPATNVIEKEIKGHFNLYKEFCNKYYQNQNEDIFRNLSLYEISEEKKECMAAAFLDTGYDYYNGYKLKTDPKKALDWFIRAAELGNRTAMQQAYRMLHNGAKGVPQNRQKAQALKKSFDLIYPSSPLDKDSEDELSNQDF